MQPPLVKHRSLYQWKENKEELQYRESKRISASAGGHTKPVT